jgi:putative membrane protein insertion efficiency factor
VSEPPPLTAARRALGRAVAFAVALPQRSLVALVQLYRLLLKPWLGNACRFEPTCSAYTLQALQQYGALRGAALGGWRVLRCHPWCQGGLDPVPQSLSLPVSHPAAGLFARLGLNDAAATPDARTRTRTPP